MELDLDELEAKAKAAEVLLDDDEVAETIDFDGLPAEIDDYIMATEPEVVLELIRRARMAERSPQGHDAMTTRAKPRPEVRWFSVQMEEKLRENDHKAHWTRAEPEYLTRRLGDELAELKRALGKVHWPNPTPEQRQHVISEAADVANFAMMIADNMREK